MLEADALLNRLSSLHQGVDGLVVAAELYRLSAQLRGEQVSDGDCLRAVLRMRESMRAALDQGDASAAAAATIASEGISPTDFTAFPSSPSALAAAEIGPGSVIDARYRLHARLGVGGMAEVFLAEALATGDLYALKLMRPGRDLDRLDEFFQQEARALKRLQHPGTPRLHAVGSCGGRVFLVTDYVNGRTLRDCLHPGRGMDEEPETVLAVFRELVATLAAAHAEGIIHRDLKPENVMLSLGSDGRRRVKVMDFGLAILDSLCPRGEVTARGEVAGTFAYMAPEQLQGAQLTQAADVYALGLIGYELFTGSNPFRATTAAECMRRHLQETAPPLSETNPQLRARWTLTPVLESVLRDALVRDPGQRISDAGALQQRLEGLG